MGYVWKAGDTGDINTTTLKDRDGNAVNLTGATVRFHLVDAASEVVVDVDATVLDAAAGQVTYTRDGNSPSTAGRYYAEYEVTYADSTVQTFPESGHITVSVVDDLA